MRYIISFLLLLFTSFSYAEEYVIIYVGAEWCNPCKQMIRDTWKTDEVKNYVMDDTDADIIRKSDKDIEWMTRWNIKSLPTTLIAVRDNLEEQDIKKWKEVDRIVGYHTPKQLLDFLKKYIKPFRLTKDGKGV